MYPFDEALIEGLGRDIVGEFMEGSVEVLDQTEDKSPGRRRCRRVCVREGWKGIESFSRRG